MPGLTRTQIDALGARHFVCAVTSEAPHTHVMADASGATPGPAPGCPGCEDFGFCFPADH
ncbi:hypothetical protein [Paraburkholderia unamae]|uniref:Uncharacterized protein n=1 Tax=Paraburkholderia unamae TaxID=219649 RepID=A0ACC6RCV2_9BURK